MIHLGGLPVVLDIFVVTVVLVWLFKHADRLADRVLERLRLHRGRLHSDGRTSRFLLSSDVRPSLHPARRS